MFTTLADRISTNLPIIYYSPVLNEAVMCMSSSWKKVVVLMIVVLSCSTALTFAGNLAKGIELLADEEPPGLAVDSTPGNCTTGGELTFSANFTDNVSVVHVQVNYTYDGVVYANRSLDNTVGEMWNGTITVNASSVYINYSFFYRDGANNTNTTPIKRITIIDNIPPIADAGDNFIIKEDETFYLNGTRSEDNVDIVNYTWSRWCPNCQKIYYYYGEQPYVKHLLEFGNYTMTLNVTDAWNNSNEDNMTVIVIDGREPVANAGRDVVIDQHETVFFNGNASWDNMGITNYTWEFFYDNGLIILYDVYTNFTFDLPGGYTITLTTRDALGNSGSTSSDSLLVTVRDTTLPVANAGNDIEIDQHETVIFNGSLSLDNIALVNYYWSFEDNGSRLLSGINASHRFDNAGIFDVVLEVADAMGNNDTDNVRVTVNDADPPVADAGPYKREINISDTLELNAGGSTDNVGIANYTWRFIYNNTDHFLYGPVATFIFYRLRTFTITLIVTDGAGLEGIDTCVIYVVDKKSPRVDAGPDRTVNEGTRVPLDATGTKDHSLILYYNWSFNYNGVQQKLSGAIVDFSFDIIGTYVINLEVGDLYGNRGDGSVVIVVRDGIPPSAEAGRDVVMLAGKTAVLNGSGSDNVEIIEYTWSFTYDGTGQTLNGKIVTFVFDIPGNYSILLTTRDGANNTGRDHLWVNVTSLPEVPDDDDITDDTEDDDAVQGEEDEEILPKWTVYLLIIIAIVFVFIVILLIVLRYRRAPPPDESLGLLEEDIDEPDVAEMEGLRIMDEKDGDEFSQNMEEEDEMDEGEIGEREEIHENGKNGDDGETSDEEEGEKKSGDDARLKDEIDDSQREEDQSQGTDAED